MYNNIQYINAMRSEIKQVDAEVTIDNTVYTSASLASVNPFFEGNLLCSVMKCCEIVLIFDDSDDIDIEKALAFKEKRVSSVKIGVKEQSSGEYIYREYGAYTVYSAEYTQSDNSLKLTCYDSMLDAMKPYNITNYKAPRTVYELLGDICGALGWKLEDLSKKSFANKDFSISAEAINSYLPLAEDGTPVSGSSFEAGASTHTFRDVLDDIAELIGGNLIFNSRGQLCIVYPQDAVIGENTVCIEADNQSEITFQKQYGPVNKVILVDSESGNALPAANSEEIEKNGECQISLSDNPLINSNRQGCITGIFSKLNGLCYTPFDSTTFGEGFLDFGDVIYVCDTKNAKHKTIVLSDNFTVSSAVNERISASEYSADSTVEYSVASAIDKVKVDLRQLNSRSLDMSERISTAQNSLNNAFFGNAVLVDLEPLENDESKTKFRVGGGLANTVVVSQYPAKPAKADESDWNSGRVVKINYNGIGVSTTGIGGPYEDFAVYYDDSKGKYCVNASDISVGILSGIKAVLDEAVLTNADVTGNITALSGRIGKFDLTQEIYQSNLGSAEGGSLECSAYMHVNKPVQQGAKGFKAYVYRYGIQCPGYLTGYDYTEGSASYYTPLIYILQQSWDSTENAWSDDHYTFCVSQKGKVSCGDIYSANIYSDDIYGAGIDCTYLNVADRNNAHYVEINKGTVTYSDGCRQASDRKKKNHIEYLSDDDRLDEFFMSLAPAEYTMKNSHSGRLHLGLYAQDVASAANKTLGDLSMFDARVVKTNPDGTCDYEYYSPDVPDEDLDWHLSYSELVAPTIAMLQKAIKRIDALENEVKELKEKLNSR